VNCIVLYIAFVQMFSADKGLIRSND